MFLLWTQGTIGSAVRATETARFSPYTTTTTNPQVVTGAGSEAIKGGMKAFADTALDTEPSQADASVRVARITAGNEKSTGVDPSVLRLQHVEVVWRFDAEANVAFKVAGLVFVALFAGPVLGEIADGSHDKGGFIIGVRQFVGVD